MPTKVRTHYDNLKVSRDAPIEVIRAAYKSLSQKYHPDRNPNDENAERTIRLINEAYEVLSAPASREQHDKWIKSEEWKLTHKVDPASAPPSSQARAKPTSTSTDKPMPRWLWVALSIILAPINAVLYVARHAVFFVGIGILIWLITWSIDEYESKSKSTLGGAVNAGGRVAETPNLIPAQPAGPSMCSPEMTEAPNGQSWPLYAAYVRPITKAGGFSTITIDNGKGRSNIYLKLARPTDRKIDGIREAFIPAGSMFKMDKVEPGSYVIKYKDIATGCNSKSDQFRVEQNETTQGIEYSEISLTIYTIMNGNMDFERVAEDSF